MVEPSILQYRLKKDQQILKEVVDFLLTRSKFYPDVFRHMVAILRGSWVPYKLPRQCSVLWACADYDPYTPITQNWPHVYGLWSVHVWPVVVERSITREQMYVFCNTKGVFRSFTLLRWSHHLNHCCCCCRRHFVVFILVVLLTFCSRFCFCCCSVFVLVLLFLCYFCFLLLSSSSCSLLWWW
jgi:hypothetical protein